MTRGNDKFRNDCSTARIAACEVLMRAMTLKIRKFDLTDLSSENLYVLFKDDCKLTMRKHEE